mgnify:CR=1 FL=1
MIAFVDSPYSDNFWCHFWHFLSPVECSRDSIKEIAETASTLAREEGLTAHARSAEFRLNSE